MMNDTEKKELFGYKRKKYSIIFTPSILALCIAFAGCFVDGQTMQKNEKKSNESQQERPQTKKERPQTKKERPLAKLPKPIGLPLLANKLEIGGSNYVIYSAGAYLDGSPVLKSGSDEAWKSPELRPIIGTYHLAPKKVENQLRDMYKNGQRKIAFMLWFAPIPQENQWEGCQAHMVDSSNGELLPQHKKNLDAVLSLVNQIGFKEVQFRFATQWIADPGNWKKWDQKQYEQNINFMAQTRLQVIRNLQPKGIKVYFDLGAELGGLTIGQTPNYLEKVWRAYTTAYGTQDTLGFSYAMAPGRLTNMIRIYDRVGKRPVMHALDVYGNVYDILRYAKQELSQMKAGQEKIIIQETWYNDKQASVDIKQAIARLKLNVHTVMQWQFMRNRKIKHFSVHYPSHYDAYLPLIPAPVIKSAGRGCNDNYCLWIVGQNFPPDATVDVRSVSQRKLLSSYPASSIKIKKLADGRDVIEMRLSKKNTQWQRLDKEGLIIHVVNSTARNWSKGFLVK